MDSNSKIIKLVQRRPVLYTKCNDFRIRNTQWKEVADILRSEVSLVKSHWHILRAKFLEEYSKALNGSRSSFKYFNDMSFLIDHIDINSIEMYSKKDETTKTQPEFEIVSKDLEDESDEDSGNVFIELEIDENESKDMIEAQQHFNISENEIDGTMFISSEQFNSNNHVVESPKQREPSQEETFEITEISDKEFTEELQPNDNSNIEIITKEHNESKNKEYVEDTSSNETSSQQIGSENLKPDSNVEELKTIPANSIRNDRCEDTIFGELVIATLREMPVEKKKRVKREIMNILFT